MKKGGIGRFSRKKGAAPSGPAPSGSSPTAENTTNAPPSGNNDKADNGTSDPVIRHDAGTFGDSFDSGFGGDMEEPSAFDSFNDGNFDMEPSMENAAMTGLPSGNSGFDMNAIVGKSGTGFVHQNKSTATASNIDHVVHESVGGNSFPSFEGTANTGHENISTIAPDSFMNHQESAGMKDNGALATKTGVSMFSNKDQGKQRPNQGTTASPLYETPRAGGHDSFFENVDAQKASAASIQVNAAGTETTPSDHPTGKEKSHSEGVAPSVTPVAQYENRHVLEQHTLVTPSPTAGTKPTSNTNDHLVEGAFEGKNSTSPPAQKVGGFSQDGASLVAPMVGRNQDSHVDIATDTLNGKSVIQDNDVSDATLGAPEEESAAMEIAGEGSFDELFSQFLVDLRDAGDLNELGDAELLDLDVDFAIAYSEGLKQKADMLDMIEELEAIEL